jgi:hypothetical protein
LVVELPPLSPPGPYQVTLRHDDGDVLVSADGTASANDGRLELWINWNLAKLLSGTYRLGLKGSRILRPTCIQFNYVDSDCGSEPPGD